MKDKEKILKAAREKKQIKYKGTPIRLSADFSAETLQARREWHDIFKVMKENTYTQEQSTQQSSHSELMENSKALQTSKLREFSTIKTALQMLKETLGRKGKGHN